MECEVGAWSARLGRGVRGWSEGGVRMGSDRGEVGMWGAWGVLSGRMVMRSHVRPGAASRRDVGPRWILKKRARDEGNEASRASYF